MGVRLLFLLLLCLLSGCRGGPKVGGGSWVNGGGGGDATGTTYSDTSVPQTGASNVQGAIDTIKGWQSQLTTNGHKVPGGSYLTQSSWYADPQNSCACASDTNTGADSSHPLLTLLELGQRLTALPGITQNTSVFLLSDYVSTDPLVGNILLGNTSTFVVYCAPNSTPGSGATSVQTGTFSAVTNLSRTSNNATAVTDASARSWTTLLGDRVRDTTTNKFTWVLLDQGSGVARVGNPSSEANTFFGATTTTGTFNTSNTYQVENLRKLAVGGFSVYGARGVAGVGFQDCEIQNTSQPIPTNTLVTYSGCRFKGATSVLGSLNTNFANCEFEGTVSVFGGLAVIDAGAGRTSSGGVITQVGKMIVDGDYIQEGKAITLAGGDVVLGAVAVFDAAVSAAGNPRGSGIVVGPTGSTTFPSGVNVRVQTVSHGTPALYGSGNAGYGLDIFPTRQVNVVSGTTLVITGTGGDFLLGSDATNITYATKATGSVAPVYGLAITPTWTNWGTAQSAGFGNNAHNVSEDAHLIQN